MNTKNYYNENELYKYCTTMFFGNTDAFISFFNAMFVLMTFFNFNRMRTNNVQYLNSSKHKNNLESKKANTY